MEPAADLDGGEQRRELVELLQSAQARGVGRAHVDDEVVGEGSQLPRALEIVGRRVIHFDDSGLADVDSDDGSTALRDCFRDHARGMRLRRGC